MSLFFPLLISSTIALEPDDSNKPLYSPTILEELNSKNTFEHYCDLDVIFLVDNTGSMQSNEIAIKEQVEWASYNIFQTVSSPRIALALVHESPKYQLINDFTTTPNEILLTLNALDFTGGGSMQEPYEYAIEQASQESFRKYSSRLLVVFADETPKDRQLIELQNVVNDQRYSTLMVNYGGPENFDVWKENTLARISEPNNFASSLNKSIDYLCFKYM